MKRLLPTIVAGMMMGSALLTAQAQRDAQPVTPAPSPGSPGIFKPSAELMATLKAPARLPKSKTA